MRAIHNSLIVQLPTAFPRSMNLTAGHWLGPRISGVGVLRITYLQVDIYIDHNLV